MTETSYRAPALHVLVVEDGDEYLTNLTTFVSEGIGYSQAHSGAEACTMARERPPDLVYLDMRFDRTAPSLLFGDLVALSSRFNGDTTRARQFQEDNQGLFILRALRESGYVGPVVLSYDFEHESRRFEALSSRDPALSYCPDYADATAVRAAIMRAVGRSDS